MGCNCNKKWDEISLAAEADAAQKTWSTWEEHGLHQDFSPERPFIKRARNLPKAYAQLLNMEMERRGIHIRYGVGFGFGLGIKQ